MAIPKRTCWLLIPAGLLAALALPGPAAGDLIFFKDGFVIQGMVKQEGTEEVDPYTHQPFFIPKGFYSVDDYARCIYFSPSQVRLAQPKELAREEFLMAENPIKPLLGARNLPPIRDVLDAPNFDSKWERTIKLRSPFGDISVPQRVGAITSTLTSVYATKTYTWASFYMTRELGPENVRALLDSHPKYKAKKGVPAAAILKKPIPFVTGSLIVLVKEDEAAASILKKRLKYCDFFLQTGWYDEVEQELARLDKSMPDFKDRIEEARAQLGGLQAREALEDIKKRAAAGQRELALQRIEDFKKKYASEKTLADLRELKAELDLAEGRIKQLKQHLADLADDLKGESKKRFKDAVAAIRGELHADNMGRLDTFLGQARQYARQKKDAKRTNYEPEQVLALALSGWLLGDGAASPKTDAALRLWRARQLIVDYQRGSTQADRKAVLESYQKDKSDVVRVDEIAQLVPMTPPTEPAEKFDTRPTELTIGTGRAAIRYHVQLPPDYTHSRSYPVIIVLATTGESPRNMLKRWATPAAENGYILMAPEWESGGIRGGYGFSEREHRTVLDSLRDLRRHYQIDSDRVFLFGYGAGGVMAFDVGLSHPDLFAGVIPMAAGPELYAEKYFRNAQILPFYVVNGDRSGDHAKLRKQFDPWALRGYPTIWVSYKGRGAEWFSAEMPNFFDWMRDKRRAFPLRQIGTDGSGSSLGNEFNSLRQTDNRFYWLSTDSIVDRCTTSPDRFAPGTTPASFFGRIDPVGNQIYLTVKGVKQITIWLGRSAKGENMIDFEKPLTVHVGLKTPHVNKVVPASLETMLEDLYQRGDKQRLFLARLDFKL